MVIPKALHPLNILLAFDGSPDSRSGIDVLRSLYLPPSSSATFLTVTNPNGNTEMPAQEMILETRRSLESRVMTATYEVVEGLPAEQIADYARQHQVDLILIGARGEGRGKVFDVLLGSVAQQVVEKADLQVWVVRSPAVPLRRILLVADGTPAGLQAAQFLGLFPFPPGCQMTVLHVIPPLPQPVPASPIWQPAIPPNRGTLLEYDIRGTFVHLGRIEEHVGQEVIKTTLRTLQHSLFGRTPPVAVTGVLREGDPASEILRFAVEARSDLIVCGSRGLGQVRGWLMHSVSRKLILNAPCSVLAVRGLIHPGEPGLN